MKILIFSTLSIFSLSLQPLLAQLPIWDTKPWLGFFAGHDRNKFAMGIKSDGSIELEIKDKKGQRMGFSKGIIILPTVMAEGEKGWAPLNRVRTTMSTTDKPTDQPKKLTYRGKVTGDAEYEVVVEFDRDKISFGGKIIDKGATKKPIKFQIRCRFQQPYKGASPESAKKSTAKDTIKYLRMDKKKGQCGIFESIDFSKDETFGPLSFLEVDMKNYMNYGLSFRSEGQLPLILENPNKTPAPPMDGFAIIFEHDPAKDPKGYARMVFEIK
jgi:hypothetical protein